MQWSGNVLDDTQERDDACNNALETTGSTAGAAVASYLWVLSKRTTPHLTSTFVCMIREMAILHGSTCVAVQNMGYAEYAMYTTEEVMTYRFKLAQVSDSI